MRRRTSSRHGSARQAERRHDQRRHARLVAGCGRLPIPAAAFESAIRADGKAVESNLRGFRAGLDAAQQASAPRFRARRRQARPRRRVRARRSRARGRRAHAGAGPRRSSTKARGGSSPIRTSPMRGAISIDSRRSAPPTSARGAGGRLLRRGGAAPCGAHVLRGRDPRRAGQDRSGAHAAHRRRDRGEARRAVHRDRVPQARHRGDVLDPAAHARQAHPRGAPSGAAGSTACIGGWRSTARRYRAICASGCWPSCAAGGREPTATRRSSARSKSWLRSIVEAARLSGDLALEVAECARLIKGYGDTHKRGSANYRLIETRVIASGAGRAHPAAPGHRRHRERTRGGAARSRGRSARTLPRRARPADAPEHRRRVSARSSGAAPPNDGLTPLEHVTTPPLDPRNGVETLRRHSRPR